ncbi:MAG: 5-(carboxyamino)imidazole ribonucleotide synthase [Micropepsaceae bacterium]
MAANPMRVVGPGGTVGILGGGQLGRMLALAAARLGLKSTIYAPENDCPAYQVCDRHVVAGYNDHDALKAFANSVDVVTYEFENVPGDAADVLSALKSVRPSPKALTVIQDRFAEKSFAKGLGIMTTPFAMVDSDDSLQDALAAIGTPSVLKTSRLGYDGKGQRIVRNGEQLVAAWHDLHRVPCILEGFVDFTRELSLVAARGIDGSVECFDLVENRHEHHILRTTLAPARAPLRTKAEAQRIAEVLLGAFGYVGVMAVEMFETRDGRLLVNEIAPRVHNSGHWTTDACFVSQFEQHIRAVCGWPLGDATRHSDAVMTNLLGFETSEWQALARIPHAGLHLYGKYEARAGRKMGHITRLYPLGTRPDSAT